MTISAPPRPAHPSDPIHREELEALVEALIEEARQRARRRRRRRAGVAALALAAIGVGYLGFASVMGGTADVTPLARAGDEAVGSATRSELVFSVWSRAGGTVYRIYADGTGLRRLTPDRGPAFPTVSPDGRRIAFTTTGARRAIYVMNIDGSGRRLLVRPGGVPSWSPDGRRIAFSYTSPPRSAGMYVIDAGGGRARRITAPCPSRAEARTGPSWSPDMSKIVYSCAGSMWLMNDDGTGAQLIADRSSFQPAAWSPDGTRIAFMSGVAPHVFVMNADGRAMRRLPPSVHYKNQDCNVTWSPDGLRLAFSREFHGGIYLMNADGTHVGPLGGVPSDACGISWGRVSRTR